MKIKITSDSTCDLSPELIKEYNIGILPVHIILGDKEYNDSATISPDEFYNFLKTSDVMPKTAAINPMEAKDFFEEQLRSDGGYDALIHFTISGEISSMYRNAEIASRECGRVMVVDSRSLSTGIGLQILYACDLVKEGLEVTEVYDKVVARVDRVQASFIIDKLTYLHKGGRCSGVALFAASALGIKPIILLSNGQMKVGKKLIGKFDKMVEEYADYILENFPEIDSKRVFITHTPMDNPDLVPMLRKKLESKFENIYETSAGCTVGAHCGPNTIGILYYQK